MTENRQILMIDILHPMLEYFTHTGMSAKEGLQNLGLCLVPTAFEQDASYDKPGVLLFLVFLPKAQQKQSLMSIKVLVHFDINPLKKKGKG